MHYYEYTCFQCPECKNKLDIRVYKNQEFMRRMEKPIPFRCVHCKSELIFSPKKRLFQAGLIGFCFFGMTSYFLTNSIAIASVVYTVTGLMLIYSLLTNKLVLVGSGDKSPAKVDGTKVDVNLSDNYEEISAQWQYEYIRILKYNLKKNGVSDNKSHRIVSDFAFDFSMLHDQGSIEYKGKTYIPKIAFLNDKKEIICSKEESDLHDYALGTASEIYGK